MLRSGFYTLIQAKYESDKNVGIIVFLPGEPIYGRFIDKIAGNLILLKISQYGPSDFKSFCKSITQSLKQTNFKSDVPHKILISDPIVQLNELVCRYVIN